MVDQHVFPYKFTNMQLCCMLLVDMRLHTVDGHATKVAHGWWTFNYAQAAKTRATIVACQKVQLQLCVSVQLQLTAAGRTRKCSCVEWEKTKIEQIKKIKKESIKQKKEKEKGKKNEP